MTLHFSLPITTAQRENSRLQKGCAGKPPRSRTAWVAHGSATVRCWRWYHFGASCAFHFGHGLHMMLTFSDLTNKFVTYEDPGCAKVGKETHSPNVRASGKSKWVKCLYIWIISKRKTLPETMKMTRVTSLILGWIMLGHTGGGTCEIEFCRMEMVGIFSFCS